MEIYKKTFRVKKIAEDEQNWIISVIDSDRVFRLSKKNVYGKIPPVWKFPWQHHSLTIGELFDFVTYAEMDGVILFDIPEEQYPERIKRRVAAVKRFEIESTAAQQAYQEDLRRQIAEYLPQVPQVHELEDSLDKWPICWRAYFLLLLPMQYQGTDSQQRLYLVYWMASIAQRLYKRHVDSSQMLSTNFAAAGFSISSLAVCALTESWVIKMENSHDDESFLSYFEVRDEFRRVLPPVSPRLELYLVKEIYRLLAAYAEDCALLSRERPQGWGAPLTSDGSAYCSLCKRMKLPKVRSLIIENSISDKELERRMTFF